MGNIDYYDYASINEVCKKVDPVDRSRPDDRPFVKGFSLFLVVFTTIYVIVSLSRFYKYQQQYTHLKKRSFLMVCTSGVGALCQVYGNALWLAVDYPCWIKVVLFIFVVPFLTMALPIRMLNYYNNHIFARRLLMALREKENQANDEVPSSDGAQSSNPQSPYLVAMPMGNGKERTLSRIPGALDMRELRKLKFLTSWKMRLILVSIMLFPNIVTMIYDMQTTPHLNPQYQCRGCYIPATTVYVLLLGGAGMTVLGLAIGVIVRKYPDPFRIVPEMVLASIFGGVIAVLGFVLDWFLPTMQNFTFGWIILLGCLNILFVTSDYQVYIARRSEKRYESIASERAQITHGSQYMYETANSNAGYTEVVSNPPLLTEKGNATVSTLKKAMESRLVLEYFEEHLVSEFSVELIRMYLECQNFKKSYHDLTEKTRRVRAKRIIETYVESTSISQVNLSDTLRSDLINRVQDKSKEIPIDFFKESDIEILRMMLGSYHRFIKTEKFQELQFKMEQGNQPQNGIVSNPSSRSFIKTGHSFTSENDSPLARMDSLKKSAQLQPKIKP